MRKDVLSRRDYALRVANGARPSRRGEYIRLLIAGCFAIVFIMTGAAHLPMKAATFKESPVPVGVLRRLDRPTHDQLVKGQIDDAIKRQGAGDLRKLLFSGETWVAS